MRVCFVSHSADSGGAERSMLDLIEALASRGVECRVAVPGRGFVTERLEAIGVPYAVSHFWAWGLAGGLPIWHRLLKRPAIHLVHAARLARVIRGWKCDVVLTNTCTVCEGALAALFLGIPHVTHVREFGVPGHGICFEWGPRLSVRVLRALSKVVVFNSRAVARHFERQVPLARARVVYNGVRVPLVAAPRRDEEGAGRGDAACLCVLVGPVNSSKGQEEAVLAVQELTRRGVTAKLQIVGDGAPSAIHRLEELISSRGLRGSIELVGHVTDPYPLLLEADVVLVCSRMEAFGRVAVEAMKLGRPVIAANSGGTPEVVRDGFNGHLYPPGDWMALADRIEAISQDGKAAREMGERAKTWATQAFNIERYGDEMLGVFRDAMAGRRTLAPATVPKAGREAIGADSS